MADTSYLDWPFFETRHRTLASELDGWAAEHAAHVHGPDVDEACRTLVRLLGQAGWLRNAVGGSGKCGLLRTDSSSNSSLAFSVTSIRRLKNTSGSSPGSMAGRIRTLKWPG